MVKARRYHPLLILFKIWGFIKNSFVFVLFLFIINRESQSFIYKYGRPAFLIIGAISLIAILLKWWTDKYKVSDMAFQLYSGVFIKSEQTVPFSKVENVSRRTSLFHRIFNMTSIQFETGMTGAEATVEFEVVSKVEADRLEKEMTKQAFETVEKDEANEQIVGEEITDTPIESRPPERIIHFKPSKKDIIKSSFTSLGFLILIPLIVSIYSKIEQFFHVEDKATGLIEKGLNSWWILTLVVMILILASAAFGIIKTYISYGNYEIASDDKRIYITQGLLDERAFSIAKDRVQAIVIKQTALKRLFGLAEVKLVRVGELSDDDGEINTLYPFLPINRALAMITEILPSYEVVEKMTCLPQKSLWIRLFKPSWFWIIASIALFYTQPSLWNIKAAWWILSIILLIWILVLRLLDYQNTRYMLHDHFIQYKSGSIATSLFVAKRDKVIEVEVSRTIVQKKFGLASIELINRAKPVLHTVVDDVPIEWADSFYGWYADRRNEVNVE